MRVAERAAEIGASAIQIFSDNPTAWRRREHLPPEVPAFRRRLAELDIEPLAIHAAYLVNLAGPNEKLFERSVEVLRHELSRAPDYGARFVNVHAGSHRGSGRDVGMARLVEGLGRAVADAPDDSDADDSDADAPDDSAADDSDADAPDRAAAPERSAGPLLVIENSSGGGDAIGVTIEDLAELLDLAGGRGLDGRLAFCLDTAHLWGAGYDISTPEEIDRILAEFDRLIGFGRLAMIHLNDTHSGLGSRHDRHAHLGEGQIGPGAMAHLLRHPALSGVAFYLETPHMEHGYDAVNMARVYDLALGRPLTPGPQPEAGAGEGAAEGAEPSERTEGTAEASKRAGT